MKNRPVNLRVGILGGGQLARMLAQSAQRMGLEVHVLSSNADDPAAQVTKHHHLGSPDTAAGLEGFFPHVDVVTFESEFLDMDLVESARKHTPRLQIFPQPSLMKSLQDRRTQKAELVRFKIPTADFCVIDTAADLKTAWQRFPKGFVLKKARGGYDGFGTFYVRNENDLLKLQNEFPGACIAEAFVVFKRELASIAVCTDKGIFFLPLIESRQTNSRCDWVMGPISHRQWTPLKKQIQKMLNKMQYRGVIAFELFEAGGKLLVNEIAPRVHNSAHYSMQGLTKSQFDLHWEAGLGLKVHEPQLTGKSFVMTNLVGESKENFVFPDDLTGALHWYGKSENRPGRKMGHINYVGSNATALLKQALKERKRIRK